jgi:ABC-type transport system involved in multi-copper enzyme maturation permease subunit
LRSPEPAPVERAPLAPLLVKELREIVSGRALWIMLLLMCPLVGYSFFQAVALYAEASAGAQGSPVLARSLSPFDGILVPSFGAFYVGVTLLFPFVAIRALGQEKESGALRLLVQLPYPAPVLIGAKLAAVVAAWLMCSVPALSTLLVWRALGGHLAPAESLNLLLGHLLYGLLVGAVGLAAAAVSESAATAAIVALAVTIGSWVLDFTLAGRPGLFAWLAQLSLTQTLHAFEQGVFSAGLVLGIVAAILGFAALAAVWLPPGVALRTKLMRSLACVAVTAAVLAGASQVRLAVDVTDDRRNSFSRADERLLATLRQPLTATIHLAPEDPRYVDVQRAVFSKLARALPDLAVRLATPHSYAASGADERYGEIEYVYGARRDVSRSTSPREILPLIYGLAGVPPPAAAPGDDFPGYPLVADAALALFWFLGALPLAIALAWFVVRRPPRIDPAFVKQVTQEESHAIQ